MYNNYPGYGYPGYGYPGYGYPAYGYPPGYGGGFGLDWLALFTLLVLL